LLFIFYLGACIKTALCNNFPIQKAQVQGNEWIFDKKNNSFCKSAKDEVLGRLSGVF
jgi:hypothetical protein